jgi:alkylated DNA repair dioxygenase AlkB
MGVVSQQTLFGDSTRRRVDLDATSWVDVWPGWLAEADASDLFAWLAERAPWAQRTRWMYQRRVLEPRLTAEYRRLAEAACPALDQATERLHAEYGVRYDGVWLNLYRDGADSTSWHGDRFTCRTVTATVPVLSLGATRRFLLRPAEGGPTTPVTVASGDLVVMGGRCQRDWRHCVPKMPRVVEPRISVNFTSSAQRDHRLVATTSR